MNELPVLAKARSAATGRSRARTTPPRRLTCWWLAWALGLWCGTAGVWAQALPEPVRAALERAGVAPAEHGTVVLNLDRGEPMVWHNAHLSLNPASTMKLVTTHAVLDLLRPDYRWHTLMQVRGRMQGDVLLGDLILRGSGDPKLVIEDLQALIAQLRGTGLREIRGQLVIDDSLYELSHGQTLALDGDRSQPYNVAPHAALLNFKAVRLTVRPASARVSLDIEPTLGRIEWVNEIRPLQGPCRQGIQGLQVRESRSATGRIRVKVSGEYSVACAEQSSMIAVLDHREFIEALFAAAWEAAGGQWTGEAVIERHVDPGLPTLAQWQSPRTLAEIVRDVNKFSNNVMARQLMLQVAAPSSLPSASTVSTSAMRSVTLERARDVMHRWLERRGLRTPEFVLDNGSGLSRHERISAAALARVLIDAAQSEHAAIFRESLPVAGQDGTMRHRLAGEAVSGQAWIKTGSLSDVRSMAGYVRSRSGRMHVVVMLVNGPRAAASHPAQDALLRWVYERG